MKTLSIVFLVLSNLSLIAQSPKADFDFDVKYFCNIAEVSIINKSTNADSFFYSYGYNNEYFYQIFKNSNNHNIGNITSDSRIYIAVVALKEGESDTIRKFFDLIQTRASFTYSVNDTLNYAPLEVQFKNGSFTRVGDSLIYNWDFGDGAFSNDTNPIHVFENPGTYYVNLTATNKNGTIWMTTIKGCDLMATDYVIVKDTAQRSEINYIVSSCSELEPPSCGYDKNFIIQNDTLKIYGFIGGNCCTQKTATVNIKDDIVNIKTYESGPECTCSCGFCFAINVPNIKKDSIRVSFDGQSFMAKHTISSISLNRSYNKIKIYPNPVIDDFTIDFSELQNKKFSVEIFNLFGKKVYNSTTTNKKVMFDSNQLKKGIYIIRVFGDNKDIYVNKIIINNAR
jgi:hypothetical protein